MPRSTAPRSRPESPSRPSAERARCRLALTLGLAALALAAGAPAARAFCGFYVAKADADLWNQASKVVMVRDGDRTVLTMANDYQGELTEFALVVPVPVVLEREQIHVGDRKTLDHLDAYTAPRLVEYFDPNPCLERRVYRDRMALEAAPMGSSADADARASALGVTVEAEYTVGEYDILILGAKESSGLETWLTENGYKLPRGASKALRPYIKQDMKFFVAKVNLEEQARTGYSYLRPIQMAFESRRFMLPLRLGMLNAREPQDLIVFALTRSGRVESSNYRTVKIPSDVEVPLFVKEEFGDFYKAMFDEAWRREDRKVVFTEYFWDMGWCDPCAADPLSREELQGLGVFWLDGRPRRGERGRPGILPPQPPPAAVNVLATRLHVRYDDEHFPEDLMFQETKDRQNFQGRYVLRHPFKGDLSCPAGQRYREQLRERRRQQAENLARLTGWPMERIRGRMDVPLDEPEPEEDDEPWWKRIWGDDDDEG